MSSPADADCPLPTYWSSHRLEGRGEVIVAFEAGLQSGDFEDLPAIFVEVHELDLAGQVFGAALEPEEGFEALAVE